MSLRALRKELAQALARDDWRERLQAVRASPKKMTGPLFQLLLHKDELVRWRAVEAFGVAMPALAEKNMESARVVARQMLWRLNEESGNMGWGVAQAMGAALAECPALADEFARILFSYVRQLGEVCHGNYLDNPMLRHGVYWGIGRLAPVRPDLVRPLAPEMATVLDPALAAEGKPAHQAMECHDAQSRGLACWIFSRLGPPLPQEAVHALEARRGDTESLALFNGHTLQNTTVGQLAGLALAAAKG